jgi:hypothetical protein
MRQGAEGNLGIFANTLSLTEQGIEATDRTSKRLAQDVRDRRSVCPIHINVGCRGFCDRAPGQPHRHDIERTDSLPYSGTVYRSNEAQA